MIFLSLLALAHLAACQLGDYIVFEPNSTTTWTPGQNATIVWQAPHSEDVTFYLTRDLMNLGSPIASGIEGLLQNYTLVVPDVPNAGDYRVVLSLAPDGPSSLEVASAPFGVGEPASTSGLPCNLGTSWTIPGVTTSPGYPPLPGSCPGFPLPDQVSSSSDAMTTTALPSGPGPASPPPSASDTLPSSTSTGTGSSPSTVAGNGAETRLHRGVFTWSSLICCALIALIAV